MLVIKFEGKHVENNIRQIYKLLCIFTLLNLNEKMKMEMILYCGTSHINSTTSTKENNICLPIKQFYPVVSNLR